MMSRKDTAAINQLPFEVQKLKTDKAGCFQALEAAIKHMNEEGEHK